MLQAPRHSRYRKWHKMRIRPINYSKGGGKLILGNTGIKALKAGRLFFKQIEAARRVISRKIKKKSRIWLRSFPDIPLSRKPSEIRMGKGKGAPHTWVHRLNAGKILLEVNSVSSEDINVLLNKAGKKLPIPCTVVHGKTARLKQQR